MAFEYHDDDLLRVHQIVSDRKAGRAGPLPIGRSTFLQGVRAGRIPQPVRLGARGVFWRWADIRRLREQGEVRR